MTAVDRVGEITWLWDGQLRLLPTPVGGETPTRWSHPMSSPHKATTTSPPPSATEIHHHDDSGR
jgi:hypothetical protein